MEGRIGGVVLASANDTSVIAFVAGVSPAEWLIHISCKIDQKDKQTCLEKWDLLVHKILEFLSKGIIYYEFLKWQKFRKC